MFKKLLKVGANFKYSGSYGKKCILKKIILMNQNGYDNTKMLELILKYKIDGLILLGCE